MAYLINFVDRAFGVREREGAQILHVTFYYPYGLAYRAALDSIKVYGILHHLLYIFYGRLILSLNLVFPLLLYEVD